MKYYFIVGQKAHHSVTNSESEEETEVVNLNSSVVGNAGWCMT